MNPIAPDNAVMRRRGPTWVVLLMVFVWCAAPLVQAQDKPAAIEPELLNELQKLDAMLEKVTDLQAEFEQIKQLTLLKKPLNSAGVLRVKAAQTRWDTLKPEPSTTLTSPKEIRIYFPNQKVVEVYRIDDRMASIIMTPLPRLKTIHEHFDIKRLALAADEEQESKGLLLIQLSPRSESLKEHLTHVKVWIDRSSAVAVCMEMTDVDGDRTTFKLSKVKLNIGLDDETFKLDLPAGTSVVHPLERDRKDRSEGKSDSNRKRQ